MAGSSVGVAELLAAVEGDRCVDDELAGREVREAEEPLDEVGYLRGRGCRVVVVAPAAGGEAGELEQGEQQGL